MGGNPHHFALPTPPSDHESENNYTNGYANTFDGKSIISLKC
jgi:hypothetical protein